MEEPTDVTPKPPGPGPEHLGDGVYVAYDGYHLCFSVNDHRAYPVVFMEYGVYQQLKEYAKRLGWEE